MIQQDQRQFSLNRTIVELKLTNRARGRCTPRALNRTIVELKRIAPENWDVEAQALTIVP